MKIAVYAICKNEHHNVKAFLESAQEADYVVVTDTGSEDQTPQAFELWGNPDKLIYTEALFDPFDFSRARNFCLAQVPEDVSYCVYLDMDERLEKGWIDKLRPLLGHFPTQVTMQMVTSRDASGNPVNLYYQTRCHMRTGYEWKYPCHEILQCTVPHGDKRAISSDIQVEHHPVDKPRDYLDLLKLGAEQYPEDQRALYYYGRELYMVGNYQEALTVLDKACFAKDLWWDKQVASCMQHMALCCIEMGLISDAETYYLKYLSYSTDEAEAWYKVAEFYYDQKNYLMALGYAKRCINLSQTKSKPHNFLFRDLSCWTWRPHDLAAYCSYYLKDYPGYALHASMACNMNPNDERLQHNVQDALTHVTVVKRTSNADD